jgi:hypothetical protein
MFSNSVWSAPVPRAQHRSKYRGAGNIENRREKPVAAAEDGRAPYFEYTFQGYLRRWRLVKPGFCV